VRAQAHERWPILEVAGRPPLAWTGWPEGKKFAFVLTHDVERKKGLDRCVQLSQLEKQRGFRSAFYFVPEGDYVVPAEIRKYLADNGFEVGVHDLKHDGFLYRSRKSFQASAQFINRYVKEWDAQGFRSGFMHHNLEWFHDLDVLYDASTFDTDPFEPQPDGVNTIFPFWVSNGNGSGYVELPYTMVQDFNLFVILQERTIDFWKRKLDWIVSRGGMALLTIHPDYINLSDTTNGKDEFSSALYFELLEYVQTKYAGLYWQALPREVAAFAAKHKFFIDKLAPESKGTGSQS
jgi:hypothetical protein